MQHGRRTASLKASYEAVARKADLTKEFTIGRGDSATSRGATSTTAAEAAASVTTASTTTSTVTVTTTQKTSGRTKK